MKNKLFIKIRNVHFQRLIIIISFINMLLAVLALAKDIFMASYLGTTVKADAFAVAFFITDMAGNNLIANAAAVSSIPIFTKVHSDNHEDNKYTLFSRLLSLNFIFLLMTSVVSLIAFLMRKQIVNLLAKGFTPQGKMLTVKLLAILLPTMLVYPFVATGISYLQVRGKFIISSLAPVLFNFVLFLGIGYCLFFRIVVNNGVFIVTHSVMIAVIAMFLLIYAKVISDSKPVINGKLINMESYARLFEMFIPYIVILLLPQAVLYYERYLASYFGGGSVAALNYAYRLAQFPIWVFVSAIGTVAFPMMANYYNSDNMKAYKKTFDDALRWILILTVPIVLFMFFLRVPIITVLFLRGAFNANSLIITSKILSGYCFAIIGQSVSLLCVRLFLSREEVKRPLLIYVLSSIVNTLLDYTLVRRAGLSAIGISAAVSSTLNAVLMIKAVNSSVQDYFDKCFSKALKIAGTIAFAAAVCFLENEIWYMSVYKLGIGLKFTFLAVASVICILVYFLSFKFLNLF